MATLALRDIRKSYLSFEVIKGINLDVADREFVVFVGPRAAASPPCCA
ncbi:hypothetical protein ACFQU7_32145 [Pseudoroseomonas wenyumeiae]